MGARCSRCRDGSVGITLGVAVGGLLACLLVLQQALVKLARRRGQSLSELLEPATDLIRSVQVKAKLLIGFYQILSSIPSVYELSLPTEVRRFASFFKLSVNLGLDQISTPLACLGLNGFFPYLVFWMA